jgi:hypothetical protein
MTTKRPVFQNLYVANWLAKIEEFFNKTFLVRTQMWRSGRSRLFFSIFSFHLTTLYSTSLLKNTLVLAGSHQECQYELMANGVPLDSFPIDFQGNLKKKLFLSAVDAQRKRELATPAKSLKEEKEKEDDDECGVDGTFRKDVLVGLQQPCSRHNIGNLHLTGLIRKLQSKYDSSSTVDKICITWEIVKMIQEDLGGRFLEKNDSSSMWNVAPDAIAREVVEVGFSTGGAAGTMIG